MHTLDTRVDSSLDSAEGDDEKRIRDAVYLTAEWQLDLLKALVLRRGCRTKSELWRALLYEEGVRAGLIPSAR